jgi:hypothetical protein
MDKALVDVLVDQGFPPAVALRAFVEDLIRHATVVGEVRHDDRSDAAGVPE